MQFLDLFSNRHLSVAVGLFLCSGKSFYSAKLAAQYYIPHLSLSSMLADALANKDEFAERLQAALVESANALKLNKNKKQKAKEKAAALAAAGGAGAPAKGSKRNASVASAPTGPVDLSLFDPDVPRLPAYLLSKLVKNRVRTPLCRNKGFVLDGFPRTVEESRWFFSPDVEEDPETGEPLTKIEDKRALAREAAALAEEEGDEAPQDPPEPQPRDPTTMVDSIVFLGCSESMAAQRCKALPAESVIPGHNDEEGFHRRWARWATIMELNPATATGAALASATAGAPVHGGDAALSPLSFVQDSVEVLELSESVAADSAKALQLISIYCNTKTGRAANYHPTPEEEAQAKQAADTKQQQAMAKQAKEQSERAAAESAHRARHDSNAALRRAAVLLEDSMLIEASSLPIRNYLMSHVIPALVDGLLDVCKVQPEDPVDYLAEVQHSTHTANSTNTKAASTIHRLTPCVAVSLSLWLCSICSSIPWMCLSTPRMRRIALWCNSRGSLQSRFRCTLRASSRIRIDCACNCNCAALQIAFEVASINIHLRKAQLQKLFSSSR